MSEIKFVYFDLRARGEPIRLVLEAAGKPYQDVRIPLERWAQEKPKQPFSTLPYMEYKGKLYGESVAIANFFAREFGLYGKSNPDALRIDEAVSVCADFITSILNHTIAVKDESKKPEMKKALFEVEIPKYFTYLARMLKENDNSGYFVGNSVTLADLYTYNVLDSVLVAKPDAAATFPEELKKLRQKVEAHPRLKTYLSKRPKVAL